MTWAERRRKERRLRRRIEVPGTLVTAICGATKGMTGVVRCVLPAGDDDEPRVEVKWDDGPRTTERVKYLRLV